MIKVNNYFAAAGVFFGTLLVGFSAAAAGLIINPINVPACAEDEWACTTWAPCEESSTKYGIQYTTTRTCTPTVNCLDTGNTKPATSYSELNSCAQADEHTVPDCTVGDWTCTAWAPCEESSTKYGIQYTTTRTCTPTVNCLDTGNTKPATSYSELNSCAQADEYTYPPAQIVEPGQQPADNPSKPACTADQWTCSAWSECVDAGEGAFESTRTCAPTADCDPNSATKPVQEYGGASCQLAADKYSQNPPSGANTSRMIIINSKVDMTGLWPSASINQEKKLTSVGATGMCASNTLIKSDSSPAVYYCGMNGRRYVFPNEKTYFSWYTDFSGVTVITPGQMAAIPIGGNATYRPGMRMVKVVSSPTVYAVAQGGVLRPIASEAVAVELYGANWNTKIDDISDAFFVNYTVGSELDLN